MPIQDPQESRSVQKFLFPQISGNSLTWGGYIRTGPENSTAQHPTVLEALNEKFDDGNLLSTGTSLPVPDANTDPFFYRTDENALYIKSRTGSGPSYTYAWIGPIDRGDYQMRLIFHSAASPPAPVISWNWMNETFNITGGNWSLNESGARWMRIVVLPGNSNSATVGPRMRIGDPTAEDIEYEPPTTSGLFPSSVNNVDEAFDYIHNNVTAGSTAPTAPTGTQSLIQTIEVNSPSGTLRGTGTFIQGDFTVDSALRNFQTNYDGTIFVEANVRLYTEAAAQINTIRMKFEILDSSGNALSGVAAIENNGEIRSAIDVRETTIRISGNLPANFAGGRWRIETLSNPASLAAGVRRVRIEMRPDLESDEVIMKTESLGANIADDASLVTLEDFAEQVDSLPIQVADTYDNAWPAPPNGIDDDAVWVTREMPLERMLMVRNMRPQQTFTAKIRYNSAYITGSRTDSGVDSVNFSHRVWSNLPDGLSNAQLEARGFVANQDITNQTATATERLSEITIPPDATAITVGFKVNASQFDAKLAVTDYDFDVELGINASAFTASGRIIDNNTRSLQTLANKLYAHIPASDPNAADVVVATSQFGDPNVDPGGLREVLPAAFNVENTPDDAQAAFDKIDVLLQLLDNPFIANQALDWGSGFSRELRVTNSSVHRSNPIDVPQELRDLGVNIAIRVRVRLSAITSTLRGRLAIVQGESPFTRVGDNEIVNGSIQGANTFITFQRVIPAAEVQSTYRLQFQRTSSTGNVTFDRGISYLIDSAASQTGGMGQSASYREVIIWTAGGTITSRLTTANSTQTLLAGHNWGDYDLVQFNFDTAAGADLLKPIFLTMNSFESTDGYGTIGHTDLYAILVRPIGSGNNQFEVRWNGAGSIGLRRVLGINTA